ncbi:MAG: phospholipase D-like domain-containing protein [Chloroflexi bacterium]|nr:phospholipase D-like domain-containing protein [Chloroflexota bacterium]
MKRHSKQLIPVLIIGVMALAAALVSQFTSPPSPIPPLKGEGASATAAPFITVKYRFGRGYIGDNWQVYFNEPDASADRADYVDGIDAPLASAIDAAERSLDIAAFELNSKLLYEAILAAQRRGVVARIVTDDRHGLEDDSDTALRDLRAAGVPIVADNRSGLMHNKFIIVDERAVWTGSWNYTLNGTYRNNNNVLVLESAGAAAAYKTEFEEMFERGEFGARSSNDGVISMGEEAGEISIIFAPEADEIAALRASIGVAQSSIRFMSFVFSLDELASAMIEKMTDPDFVLRGVFEERNSRASWSQLPALYCAGAQVRQDGNRYILHHKIIIIDDDTVITGSFNFSKSATQNNDENIVIIRNPVIASLYLEEWRRVWDSAQEVPLGEVNCD